MAEPPITLRAAHDSGRGNTPITRVVIHATCPDVGYSAASAPGTARGTAHYFATAAAGGSAHYVCGVDDEEHCVPEDVIAWHAPPNPHSLGIEITAEGGAYAKNYSRQQWLSAAVWPAVQRAAARCRDLCDRYGVPTVKLSPADLLAGKHGICGHEDVSQAWHQTDHTDPGAATFPWPEFMAEVNATEGDDMFSDPDRAALMEIEKRIRGGNPNIDELQTLQMGIDNANAKLTALTAALQAVAAAPGGLSAAELTAAAKAGADQALAELAKRLPTS